MILSNQVRCTLCGDEPFSRSVHDYRSCKCGAVAVDGGMQYLKRVGGSYKELSIELPDPLVKELREVIEDDSKNSLGILCAVVRTMRNNGIQVGVPKE